MRVRFKPFNFNNLLEVFHRSPPETWISAFVPVVVWGGCPMMEPRATSFFTQALQGSVTSQLRSIPGPSLQRPVWAISLGKGSECNSSTESNQLSSRWIPHRTSASMAGFSQTQASWLNLIYTDITYYLHKTLQPQASVYYNLSLRSLLPAITL